MVRRTVLLALVLTFAAVDQAQAASYVALGDSYSSGVGSRSYYSDGTSCQRSPYAYAPQVASSLGYTLNFQACGGAVTNDVLTKQDPALTTSTARVTISIGGNDAGFSSVIQQCAKPWPFTCWGDIDNAQNFIRNTLPGRLDSLYSDIRRRAPSAKVVVVGYPRIFNGQECNAGSRISSGEQTRLNDTANIMAGVISARAAAHGFGFVDPRTAFTGHAVCDSVEWINGLSNPTSESYHPNRSGYTAYASLVTPALR